jgi:hypothetical protein
MKPRPIALVVRSALITTTPALLATGVGIAHGRVAEAIVRCSQGQAVAMCGGQHVDEQEPHRHPITLPSEPPASASPPPDDVPWGFWDDGADDETHQIAVPSPPVAEPLHEPHYQPGSDSSGLKAARRIYAPPRRQSDGIHSVAIGNRRA